MQKNTGNKVKLGLFVCLGLMLFIIGIYYVGKRQKIFGRTFALNSVFKNINGLQVGNTVRFSGIDVGVVAGIQMIRDTSILVELVIEEKVKKFIAKDAKATIGTDGLMGNKLVIIVPGTSKGNVGDNDFIPSYSPVGMDNITSKLQRTTDNLANITDDLSVIMDNIRSGKGTVGMLFMDTVFAQNLQSAVVNIRQGAGGFSRNMQAASHSILLRGFFKKKDKEKDKDKKKE
jgi:phospholipid/cholesterol/gamma-HCH transport system substrate-binding protein